MERKIEVQFRFTHTIRLPSSVVVVYRNVQKSRAGTKVVGAYICRNITIIASTKNESRGSVERLNKHHEWSKIKLPTCM